MSEHQPPAKLRVAVVFGGRSPEHSVSCITAGSVLQAIDRTKYDVVPVGITREGRWVLAADEPERLSITAAGLPEVGQANQVSDGDITLAGAGVSPTLVLSEAGQVPQVLGAVDVVLPLLHGPFGEDGTLQGMLEMTGVRYVGSGVLASAVGMDKHHMKIALAAAGLPIGRYVVATSRRWMNDADQVQAEIADLGLPVFVKPARGGSSIGISRVDDLADLPAAVALAQQHDPKVIVEECIVGREVECGVLEGLGGAPHDVSVLGEIRVETSHAFYDFDAKYTDENQVHLDVPAEVTSEVSTAATELAIRAFDALGCEGLARVDFFLRPDGSLLVNEVNTMPGFTPFSMFPAVWAASGVNYPALLERLIHTALNKPLGLR